MLTDQERKILRALGKDARASFRKLAKRVGLAPATLIQKVRGLEEKGVVRRYIADVDAEKLGYDVTAFIEVQSKRGMHLAAEKALATLPNVCAVYDLTGSFDFVIIAKFKGRDELSRFVRGLLLTDQVERTNTRIALSTVKEDYGSIGLADR